MKAKFENIIFIALFTIMIPGWLYASGNLPITIAPENKIVMAVNELWPDLAEKTYKKTHRLFEYMRRSGLNIPYSYNERLARIAFTRAEVNIICDSIINE